MNAPVEDIGAWAAKIRALRLRNETKDAWRFYQGQPSDLVPHAATIQDCADTLALIAAGLRARAKESAT